jgi:hypothetical protein
LCSLNKCIGIEFIDLVKLVFCFKNANDKFIVLFPLIKDRDIPFIGSVMGNPKKALYRLICGHEIFGICAQSPKLYAMIAMPGNYMAYVPGKDIFGDLVRVCGA